MRFFTPEEANRALDAVRPLTEMLVAARSDYVRRAVDLEHVRRKVAGNGGGLDARTAADAQAAAEGSLAEIDALLGQLDELGVQVKDLDRGLIDFPARHPDDDAPVLLCWQLGEDEVGWWHSLEDGFAGRKPLPF